jgi:hypothetical protein
MAGESQHVGCTSRLWQLEFLVRIGLYSNWDQLILTFLAHGVTLKKQVIYSLTLNVCVVLPTIPTNNDSFLPSLLKPWPSKVCTLEQASIIFEQVHGGFDYEMHYIIVETPVLRTLRTLRTLKATARDNYERQVHLLHCWGGASLSKNLQHACTPTCTCTLGQVSVMTGGRSASLWILWCHFTSTLPNIRMVLLCTQTIHKCVHENTMHSSTQDTLALQRAHAFLARSASWLMTERGMPPCPCAQWIRVIIWPCTPARSTRLHSNVNAKGWPKPYIYTV